MMLSKQNTITSDMWADVFSANETYGCTTPHLPPLHVHTLGLTCITPFLTKRRRHAQTPTVTLHFHPGVRRASLHHFKLGPASSDGRRPRLLASAGSHKTLTRSRKATSDLRGLKEQGDVITAGLLLCRSAAPECFAPQVSKGTNG